MSDVISRSACLSAEQDFLFRHVSGHVFLSCWRIIDNNVNTYRDFFSTCSASSLLNCSVQHWTSSIRTEFNKCLFLGAWSHVSRLVTRRAFRNTQTFSGSFGFFPTVFSWGWTAGFRHLSYHVDLFVLLAPATTEWLCFLKPLNLNSHSSSRQISNNRRWESGNSDGRCCAAFPLWEWSRMLCIYTSANERRHIFFMSNRSSVVTSGQLDCN